MFSILNYIIKLNYQEYRSIHFNIILFVSDCVKYSIAKHPRQTVTKTFQDRIRLATKLLIGRGSAQTWEMNLTVTDSSLDRSCIFQINAFRKKDSLKNASSSNEQRIANSVTGFCSSWVSPNEISQNLSSVKIEANFISFQYWSHMTIGLYSSGNLVLLSTKLYDVELIELPNSGLVGPLTVNFHTEEDHIDAIFDCDSGKTTAQTCSVIFDHISYIG